VLDYFFITSLYDHCSLVSVSFALLLFSCMHLTLAADAGGSDGQDEVSLLMFQYSFSS